jgi:hypothetical protein
VFLVIFSKQILNRNANICTFFVVGEVPSRFNLENVEIKNYKFELNNISKLFYQNKNKFKSLCEKADIFLIFFSVMCEKTLKNLDNVSFNNFFFFKFSKNIFSYSKLVKNVKQIKQNAIYLLVGANSDQRIDNCNLIVPKDKGIEKAKELELTIYVEFVCGFISYF